MTINERYADELRENKPIECCGVTLWPLRVRDFALFQNARPAMELMLSSLAPKLARLSWFSCLQELDAQAEQSGTRTNFVGSVLLLLAKALRLEAQADPNDPTRTAYPLIPLHETQTGRIACFQIGWHAGTLLDARSMGEIRAVLAAQNGYSLPDENWNPELVRAQRYTREQRTRSAELDADIEALVCSVAIGAHMRPADMWDLPLREFFNMESAVDRAINYQVFAAAEAGGMVKFKRGNPYPSWRFNRKAELPGEFQSLAELDAGAKGLLTETNE